MAPAELSTASVVQAERTHHVERGDVFERYISILEVLHEVLIYNLWTAAGWQSEHEWLLWCWFEGFDAFFILSDIYTI